MGTLQLLAQLSQLRFQFAPPLTNLTDLLLGTLPKLRLFLQGFGQLLNLLLNSCLRRLQFPNPRFKLGLFCVGSPLFSL